MYLLLHIIIELSANTRTRYLVNLFSSKWVVSGARHYKFCFVLCFLFVLFFCFLESEYLPTVSRIYLPTYSQGYLATQREKKKRWI